MHIVVVGLNYKTAPVDVREQVTISPAQLGDAMQQLYEQKHVMEAVIVATCNRMEMYAVIDSETWCPKPIRDFWQQWFSCDHQAWMPYTYAYEDEEAVRHLMRVTAGLDSMVCGETQILGQVRDAFMVAQQRGTTGTLFHKLFREAITVAKKAHTETGINDRPVSVASVAVSFGERIVGTYAQKKIVLLGAGELSALAWKHLKSHGADDVTVVNRSLPRAYALANQYDGRVCPYAQRGPLIAQADVVFALAGADEPLVTAAMIAHTLASRAQRPLVFLDLAMPRNIEPAIGQLDGVHLYDLDDVATTLHAHQTMRKQEAQRMETWIEEAIVAFDQWYQSLGVGPLIGALQKKATFIHAETMEAIRRKLPHWRESDLKIVHKLSKSMINQLLFDPIQRLKEMAPTAQRDEVLAYFSDFFALQPLVEEARITDVGSDEHVPPPVRTHVETTVR